MGHSSSLPEEFRLLRTQLDKMTDRRCNRGKVHPLEGVLSLTVLALMCGQRSLSAVYRFGDTHPHLLSPNPPKDTDGRREDSGRGVRELPGRWPGLHWGRWEVGGRSSVAAQGPYGRLRELRCAGWRENTQQGTLADRGGASLRGRWVSRRLAVRPGVEWLAAGPRRE